MRNRLLLPALLLSHALAAGACGDDDSSAAAAEGDGDAATGTVAVHLEEVEGVFMEGFEVGLRFETPDGEVLGSTLWSDFVQSQSDEPTMEDHYTSVFEQEVPAGEIVVLAEANVGIGPPPEVPDLDGDLRCRLVVDVPDGATVDVEVTFSGDADCLRLR